MDNLAQLMSVYTIIVVLILGRKKTNIIDERSPTDILSANSRLTKIIMDQLIGAL